MDLKKEDLQPEEELDDDMEESFDDMDDNEEMGENREEEERNDKVIQNKVVFALLCLLMFSLPVLWFFGVGIPVDTDAVFVGNIVETADGKMEVPLQISSSGLAFTVTTQHEEDGVLTLKPRASLVGLHQSGSTTISIKVPAEELKEIWLEGDDENDRLRIWRNEE